MLKHSSVCTSAHARISSAAKPANTIVPTHEKPDVPLTRTWDSLPGAKTISLVTSKSPMAFTGCRTMLSMILHAVLLETATKTTMHKQQKRSCISALKPTILTASKRSMLQTDSSTDKWDTYLLCSMILQGKSKRWGMEFVLPSLWRRRINPRQRNHFKKIKGSWASKSSARCNATIRADICKYNQIYSRWRNKNVYSIEEGTSRILRAMPSHASNARTSIQSLKRGFLSTHASPQRMNLIHPQHLTNYKRPEIVFPPHRWKFFTDQYLFCCLAASDSHFRILRLINQQAPKQCGGRKSMYQKKATWGNSNFGTVTNQVRHYRICSSRILFRHKKLYSLVIRTIVT